MLMPHRRFKDVIYEQLSRLGKAISAPKRLELLDLLCQGPRSVDALAEQAGISMANASHHLQALREARLVESEKKGLRVKYRLAEEAVSRFFLALREVGEARLAEVEKLTREYFHARGALEAVAGPELLRRVRTGQVTVLDVRPREEYRAGHIPGAVSIPVSELRDRLKELPKQRNIVAYCRGPYCILADEAVRLLTDRGYRAQRLEIGFPEWKALGLPVETAA